MVLSIDVKKKKKGLHPVDSYINWKEKRENEGDLGRGSIKVMKEMVRLSFGVMITALTLKGTLY